MRRGPLARKTLKLLVVPHVGSDAVRRYELPRWLPRAVIACVALFVLSLIPAVWRLVEVTRVARDNAALRSENAKLKTLLEAAEEKAERVGDRVELARRLDVTLRQTTMSNAEPVLAVGPTNEPVPAKIEEEPAVHASVGENLLPELEALSGRAARCHGSLDELAAYFPTQKARLAATPSIWPMRGLVTSAFGGRADPFTSQEATHTGLDINAHEGQKIVAPAAGVVIFAGPTGGYGNAMVIDHGFGIRTRYAHLSAFNVKVGDKVDRGQLIAAAGSTGHSTGPHLHYEVRVNGVSKDPRVFILEDL